MMTKFLFWGQLYIYCHVENEETTISEHNGLPKTEKQVGLGSQVIIVS